MRIGQRLALQTSVVFLVSACTMLMLAWFAQRNADDHAAGAVLRDADQALSAMQVLGYEMRYWHFERAHHQWRIEREALLEGLAGFQPADRDERAMRENLIRQGDDLLPRLVEALRNSRSRDVPHAEDLVDIQLRRLLTTQAIMANDVHRLLAGNSRRMRMQDHRSNRFMQAMLVLFILVSAASGWRLYVAAVRPLLSLRRTTAQLAQGDLGARSSVRSNDEFGELARGLDQMAEALQTTLASRAELEREIRARRALARNREAALAELQRSNAELDAFAYVASHDLQEPLRVVSSFLQLIERRYGDQLDAKGRRWIAFAVDGAQRMYGLIDDLLSYSRVTTRARPFVDVDLEVLMGQVRNDLAETIAAAGAELQLGPLPTIHADVSQLRQLLQNLVANAVKFAQPGRAPRICVRAEPINLERPGAHTPAWRICVEDNGIGIEPAYHERIFQVFQRLHTREEYPGTGIGLAICKKIAERHGGTIHLRSTPGEGSCFCVDLPPEPPRPALPPSPQRSD